VSEHIYNLAVGLTSKLAVSIPMTIYQARKEKKNKQALEERQNQLKQEREALQKQRETVYDGHPTLDAKIAANQKQQEKLSQKEALPTFDEEVNSWDANKPGNLEMLRAIASKEGTTLKVEQYEMKPVDWSADGPPPAAKFEKKTDLFRKQYNLDALAQGLFDPANKDWAELSSTTKIRLMQTGDHHVLGIKGISGDVDYRTADLLISRELRNVDQACLTRAILFARKHNELIEQEYEPKLASADAARFAADPNNVNGYIRELQAHALNNQDLRTSYSPNAVKDRPDLVGGGRGRGNQAIPQCQRIKGYELYHTIDDSEKSLITCIIPDEVQLDENGKRRKWFKRQMFGADYKAQQIIGCKSNLRKVSDNEYVFEILEISAPEPRVEGIVMSKVLIDQLDLMKKHLPKKAQILGIVAKNVMDRSSESVQELMEKRCNINHYQHYISSIKTKPAIPRLMILVFKHLGFSNGTFSKEDNDFILNPHSGLYDNLTVLEGISPSFYGYTMEGIDDILALRLSAEASISGLTNTLVLPGSYIFSEKHSNIHTLLFYLNLYLITLMLRRNNQDMNRVTQPAILAPISLYGKHAVGVMFVAQEDGSGYKAFYLDPENTTIPEGLATIFNEHGYEVEQLPTEGQRYTNCGPEVIENFMLYLTGERLSQEDAIVNNSRVVEQELLSSSYDAEEASCLTLKDTYSKEDAVTVISNAVYNTQVSSDDYIIDNPTRYDIVTPQSIIDGVVVRADPGREPSDVLLELVHDYRINQDYAEAILGEVASIDIG
jgi:hypothetical protein